MLCDAEEAGQEEWQEGHEKELGSLRHQGREFMKDAYNAQLLPSHLVDAELVAEAHEKLQAQVKRDAENSRKLARVAKMWDRPKINLDNKSLSLFELESASDNEQIADIVVKHNLMIYLEDEENEVHEADYILSTNLDQLSLSWRKLAVASLTGRTICNVPYLSSEGEEGSAMAFKPAVATIRHVWLSDGFRQQEPLLSRAIYAAMGSPMSKWRLIEELPFLEKLAKNPQGFKFIGLVSDAEKEDSCVS